MNIYFLLTYVKTLRITFPLIPIASQLHYYCSAWGLSPFCMNYESVNRISDLNPGYEAFNKTDILESSYRGVNRFFCFLRQREGEFVCL